MSYVFRPLTEVELRVWEERIEPLPARLTIAGSDLNRLLMHIRYLEAEIERLRGMMKPKAV